MTSSKYDKRGVSASKTEVHGAIKNLDKGLFPNAFCKILPDVLSNDPKYCSIMHADTAGTKTSLAYLYWQETGDDAIWKGIMQDAIVMNLDDLACVGAMDDVILSNTIGRNKSLIPGAVLEALIEGGLQFIDKMRDQGVHIYHSGGETADVGDVVRTIDVGFTAYTRLARNQVIENNIKAGDVIVGLASDGQAVYEDAYNSGIGSNGLTFARHEVLAHSYAANYPESYDPHLDQEVVYNGKYKLTDKTTSGSSVGALLLAPTRTYLPVLKQIFETLHEQIHGIIHCTGGGQTKILNFVKDLHVIKNNLFKPPEVFNLIQSVSNTDLKEMYQVFNMGHRIELYVPESKATEVINIAREQGVDAKIIGHCEAFRDGKKLTLDTEVGKFTF